MTEFALLQNTLLVGAVLFALGFIGFLVRRNMIVMFLSAELMLQGVSLTLVAWGRYRHDWGGQMLVVFILTVAACEAAVALVLFLLLAQRSGKLDATVWQELREDGQPAYTDRLVPEEHEEDLVWPRLTRSGLEPAANEEEEQHRSRV